MDERRQLIGSKLKELNQSNAFLDSAKRVKETLKKDYELEVTELEVTRVMREDLGMKFRKVVPISIHGNSVKNLVLR